MRTALPLASLFVTSCSLLTDTEGLSSGGLSIGDGGSAETGAVEAGADGGSDARAGDGGGVDGSTTDPSLVAEWRFDETSGTTARDSTGHGHDGTVVDATFVTGGHAGGALSFGMMGAVKIPASPEFDRSASSSFTITAWARPGANLGHSFIFSVSYGPSMACFGLEMMDDTHVNYFSGEFGSGGGPAHVAISPVPSTAGTWSHVAAVVENGTDVRMYFGGVRVGTGKADATPRKATEILLGTNNYPGRWKGSLDNVRFYARALTDAEVAADRDR